MLRTAQLLDMDCFDTKIEFYQRNYIPLRATSTLQQNDVKDGDVLKARVTRTTKSETNRLLLIGSSLYLCRASLCELWEGRISSYWYWIIHIL
jgi:hypothetical protein